MDENTLENIIALAIVVIIVAGAIFAVKGLATDNPEDSEQRFPLFVEDDPSLGSPEAPVRIIEFSDFSCIFCAEFAVNSKSSLQEYIDNGTVRFVFKDFPLSNIHPKAPQLAKAANCAHEQGKFWEYHDLLYQNMDAHELTHIKAYAQDLELNMSAFDSCFANEDFTEIQGDIMQGREVGVRGTPTFFFNGRRVTGALTAEELVQEINKELTLE